MKKSKGIISLILMAALVVFLGFTTVSGFGKGATGAAKNIKLGLDLEGGVSITYQVKGGTPSAEDMADTIYKLQRRVEQYSTGTAGFSLFYRAKGCGRERELYHDRLYRKYRRRLYLE